MKEHPIRLTLPQAQISAFKRKALRSKKEILALMVGTIIKENERVVGVVVEDLVYPKVEATTHMVVWDPADVVKLQAQVLPKAVIGTLHSHPGDIPHISKADIESATAWGETVSGIFSWWVSKGRRRRETSLDFYYGTKPLRLEVRAKDLVSKPARVWE